MTRPKKRPANLGKPKLTGISGRPQPRPKDLMSGSETKRIQDMLDSAARSDQGTTDMEKKKSGGRMKKMATGGSVRGTGAAVRGKGFSGIY